MHREVIRNPEVVNKLILIDMLTLDEVTFSRLIIINLRNPEK